MKRGLLIDKNDNVGIVVEAVAKGDEISIEGKVLTALEDIRPPHKIALIDFNVGDDVIKYGVVMGYATQAIKAGQHVHVHNVDSEKMMK